MRVTKTIREYIEDQVYNKAMQSEKLVELKTKMDKAIKDFNEDKKKAVEVCQVYVDQLINRYQLNVRSTYKPCVSFSFCYDNYLPEVCEYNKARQELEEKARRITRDIIVEMELGGTKADLTAKLDALKF